jgi:hypothetical protein
MPPREANSARKCRLGRSQRQRAIEPSNSSASSDVIEEPKLAADRQPADRTRANNPVRTGPPGLAAAARSASGLAQRAGRESSGWTPGEARPPLPSRLE